MVAILVKMNVHNNTLPDKYSSTVGKRQPRHVLQKARELFFKVQDLREQLNFTRHHLPTLPSDKIEPADVKMLVDAILLNLNEVSPKLIGQTKVKPAVFVSGKKPTDVYLRLHTAVYLVDSLTGQKSTPSNVYRVAVAALHDIHLISLKLKIDITTMTTVVYTNKVPADVFAEVLTTLRLLHELCESNQNHCLPGGIIVPARRTWISEFFSPTKPRHVLDLMNNLIADLEALKTKLGIKSAAIFPVVVKNKTPSDVFDMVKRIQWYLQQIKKQ